MRQNIKSNKENQTNSVNRLKEHESEINPYDRTYYSYKVENKSSQEGEVFIVEQIQHKSQIKLNGGVPSISHKSIKSKKVVNRTSGAPAIKKENL